MIFATLGTHAQPFPRFLSYVNAARATGHDVILQYGHTSPPPGLAEAFAFLSGEEMVDHFERADAVLSHAGVGSILGARQAGHLPVVIARQARFGEHVDDHQLELSRMLAVRGHVLTVTTPDELPRALTHALQTRRSGHALSTYGPLHAAVRAALR